MVLYNIPSKFVKKFELISNKIFCLYKIFKNESKYQKNGNVWRFARFFFSMGSPLWPLFANVFMADFEEKHMEETRGIGLNIWSRYVDNDFATVSYSYRVRKQQETSISRLMCYSKY